MKSSLRSLLQIGLLFVTCCSALTSAKADVISWLTGNFELVGSDLNFRFPPPYGTVSFVPPADLPYTSGCFSCGDPAYEVDWTYYDGSAVGGSVAMLARFQDTDPYLSFTGWMTGGHITGYIQTVCHVCNGDPINTWTYDVAFRGTWSSEWWSEGSAQAVTVWTGGNFGSLDLSTNTPEPGTLVLFGSSLLGAAGLLRRR